MAVKSEPVKKGSFTANNIFIEIQKEAERLHAFKSGQANMYEELLKIDTNHLEDLYKRYNGDASKPVNNLRAQILYRTLGSETLDRETIDVMKSEIRGNSERDSFRSYDDFSILYPILLTPFSFNVKESLTDIGQRIIKAAELESIAARPHVVDFNGSRNFGADFVWMAIYNSSHENQEQAVQFLLDINKDGVEVSVFDRFNNKKIRGITLFEDEDMHQKMYNFFRDNRRSILNDVKKETLTYRTIGIQGKSIYKISYGLQFFPSHEEIQNLINNNLVVAQDGSLDNDQNGATEFGVFENAQPGDYFYLCWGNKENVLIGQFNDSKVEDYQAEGRKGWKQRGYRFVFQRTSKASYSGPEEWWTPIHESPISHIPNDEIERANELIFRDFFQVEFDPETPAEYDGPESAPGAGQEIPINERLDAKLEVEIVAKELAGIIENLDDNKGQMLGIFGSWGRGKTFLYEQVRSILKPVHKSDKFPSGLKHNYTHHTFNAWKYQETQAIWAHLYGTLLDKYLEGSNYVERQWKIFKLNLSRKGPWPFIIIFTSVILTILTMTFSAETVGRFDGIIGWIRGFLGVAGVNIIYFLYKKYYKPVKEALHDYSSINDYSSVLGLQAEIQSELLVLTRNWLKDKKDEKQRLLLFIDDLDRCSEEKIIQVIDALRVMLDDEELIRKIVVLVAVDELLLERAIEHKYNDFGITANDPKDVVKEYMDKLFIGGVKLPKLSKLEQAVILEAYAEKNNFLEREAPQTTTTSNEENTTGDQNTQSDDSNTNTQSELIFTEIVSNNPVVTSDFSLLKAELKMLESYAEHLSQNVTPRQLRIYMYRYLLAKNVASSYLSNEQQDTHLSDAYCDFLARAIAERSNHGINSIEYEGALSLNQIENKTLRTFTPKLIEIVVPY
jgi:hypothetical protein